jgi:hypothetical protein
MVYVSKLSLQIHAHFRDDSVSIVRVQARFNTRPARIIHCVRKVTVHLDLWGAAKSAVYRDRPRTLNELKLQ